MKRLIKKSTIIITIVAATIFMSEFSTYAVANNTKISGYTAPTTLTEGQAFSIKGQINSNQVIKRVEIGVVYANTNKWTSFKYDNNKVNSKSFNIAKYADPKIRFGKIKAGTYYYRIYAHTTDKKVHTLLNKKFTVKSKAKTTAKTLSNKATTKKTTSSTTANKKNVNTSSTNRTYLTGVNKPGNYKVGKAFRIKGFIKSQEKINRVEIGIVFAATNKWTDYKYDKKLYNAKTFDISKADNTLKFSKLPGGKFRYRIYAHTASGVKLLLDHPFTVTASNKAQMAVNWAKKIAADDSFTYGKKPETSNVGCYFCGTNHGPVKYRKPKGYEKTYVCLTFVGAAYAHGAHDPEILAQCKQGRMTMYSNDDNFSKFSCWMKIGRCRDLNIKDLLPGDVIVDWSSDNGNGHVWMYIGGDSFVDAEGLGWSKESIAVRGGAESYLRWCGKDDSRNYVMRYIK